MMKPAGIYCRLSRDREGRMLGIERQEQDCRELAARLGLEVADVYLDDDISASTRTRKIRPDYRRLLRDAQAGRIGVVLAYTSSRLTRKPREHEDLIELAEAHHVKFHYVSSPDFDLNTAAGRRVARILAATDAGEAEDTAERIARQRDQMAAAGLWKGGRRPYGYATDGITVIETEAATLRHMAGDIIAGGSIRQLVIALNAAGATTSTGRPWRHDAVRAVLLRPRNAGLMEHRGKVVGPAVWPGILEEGEWRAVVAALTAPGRRTQVSSARRWLLSGLLRCGVCGERCKPHQARGHGRKNGTNYVCGAGKHIGRFAAHVDAYVSALVIERLASNDLVLPESTDELAAAHAELLEVRERLDAAGAAFGTGAIDAGQLAAATTALKARQAAAESVVARFSGSSALAGVLGAADIGAAWEVLTLDRKRAIIDTLMTLRLMPARRGRPAGWRKGQSYFDPNTVEVTWR